MSGSLRLGMNGEMLAAVLANGGYKVEPYFIQRIEDATNRMLRA